MDVDRPDVNINMLRTTFSGTPGQLLVCANINGDALSIGEANTYPDFISIDFHLKSNS